MKTIDHCPVCGSDDVERFLAYWVNSKTGKMDLYGPPEMYPCLFWCNSCDGEVDHLDTEEVNSEAVTEAP